MMEIFGGAAFSIDIQAYIAIVFRGSGSRDNNATSILPNLLQESMALADLRFAGASISKPPRQPSITTPHHLGNQAISYKPPSSKDPESNDTPLPLRKVLGIAIASAIARVQTQDRSRRRRTIARCGRRCRRSWRTWMRGQ
jgi:hypothetical protein